MYRWLSLAGCDSKKDHFDMVDKELAYDSDIAAARVELEALPGSYDLRRHEL